MTQSVDQQASIGRSADRTSHGLPASWATLLLLAGMEVLLAAEAPGIEIFTTARTPISTASIPTAVVYNLDLPALIEAELSMSLPRDREAAAQLASAELQGAWRKTAETLTHAYQGLLKARQYGLQELPAMVFDGQAVVYGVIDLEQALGDYQRWRDSKR